jgi:hypothetical protein
VNRIDGNDVEVRDRWGSVSQRHTMEKTVTRGPLFKIILKEFAAPLAIATLLLVVLLYGHVPL